MSAYKSRAVSAKGVSGWRPYVTRGVPIGSVIRCADNTGARTLRLINISGYHGRLKRVAGAAVGDHATAVVSRGPPELRKQTFGAVVIRQKYPVRRVSGQRIMFEDNAAVIVTPEGDMKGTDIKGPVAAEAAERWPRIANLATMII